jgi:hypothetical protein
MSKTPVQLQDISVAQQLDASDIVYLPKISAPFTTVVNRAKMVDLANDMSVRMGIERIPVQQIMRVNGEVGPNGEVVFKPVNDKYDQIRFVGNFSSINNAAGQIGGYSNTATADYCEITFYGTGLNLLASDYDNTGRDARASVDGGAEGANFLTTPLSAAINGRNYSQNIPVSVVSGLALDVHTVKIRNINWLRVSGFEILNEQFLTTTANTNSSTLLTSVASTTGLVVGMDITGAGIPANTTISGISGNTITMSAAATATATGVTVRFGQSFLKIAPGISYSGSKKLTKTAVEAVDYKTGFESGTLGTRGGHVVVYQKKDNTVGKAVTSTNASTAYLSSASHTNEEVIRTYNWREFGAGRTDDFSSVTGSSTTAKAFTLDDGTTTLVTTAVQSVTNAGLETAVTNSTSDFLTLTFVGTGLDILCVDSNTSAQGMTVTIDGSAQTLSDTGSTSPKIRKICSGLPYGTHTVKFQRTTSYIGIAQFIVYAPKKPSIPAGSIELADYYVMADYSPALSIGSGLISSGTLRKQCTRESVYSGTWSFSGSVDPVNFDSGANISTGTVSSYYQYVFFGTGVNCGFFLGTVAANATFTITNLATGAAVSLSGITTSLLQPSSGLSFTASTGLLSGTNASAGRVKVLISGLPIGMYSVRVTQNTSTALSVDYFDVITPIHTHKNNGPFVVQNTLSVGSQGINDGRKFGDQLPVVRSVSQAAGVVADPSTTSTTMIPCTDMSVSIKTNGNPIRIGYSGVFVNNTAAQGILPQIYVDGVAVGSDRYTLMAAAGYNVSISDSFTVPVQAGHHQVLLMFRASAATVTAIGVRRNLTVEEIANS